VYCDKPVGQELVPTRGTKADHRQVCGGPGIPESRGTFDTGRRCHSIHAPFVAQDKERKLPCLAGHLHFW
jgi:hypothetical protein